MPKEVEVPFIKRHSLTLGIALMFLLTWPFYAQLGLFVGYGLSIACLIVTGLVEGRAGIGSLLRRFLLWRVGIGWYLAALLGPFALYAGALALYILVGGAPVSSANSLAASFFGPSDHLWLVALPFLLIDALTNGEELAWRGFVLPRYQARFSALLSSLFLGLLWGIWHLPRYLASGDPAGFGYAILHNLAMAVLFTWLYNGTGGSLLLATLLHAGLNTAYVFLPVAPAAGGGAMIQASVLALEVLAAAAVVLIHGPRTLSRRPALQVSDIASS